ncbi:hypothetical protein GCM10008014_44020 [Paenibacillus silvae]|uniref:Uncharacterized protein n=1 Tax=Paenibacillus silvae TaxID=1325358 RepID=A0ABQ1ZIE8_9BACL|nr:hypothetical protein GCM10008014_44020 [Paenibacillus silvae]
MVLVYTPYMLPDADIMSGRLYKLNYSFTRERRGQKKPEKRRGRLKAFCKKAASEA